MKLTVTTLLSLFVLLSSTLALADAEHIRQALGKAMPEVTIDSIEPSPIKGLFEVSIGANIYYISSDARYLLQGRLVDMAEKKDLTEAKLAGRRLSALQQVSTEQMITFASPLPKYEVYIFTDIDCAYCRKLHSEIDQYLAEGISIHYLFFPRAGKDSESFNKAVSVWCAKDRAQALTEAKQGHDPEPKTCTNPVTQHLQLAHQFGARGTPLIVTSQGNQLPGYVPAKQLAEVLANE
ncbi:MAG: DsbC family protein [Methylococcales bacterium]|nr:DsbC family protein [Methylococcales bacterium]